MNLINDAWIPVRRADGSRKTIAPWQLTEGIAENPIVAIASPRPDFDGALVQFLIGLLQTTCTPDEKGWWDWRDAPPSPTVLRGRFAIVAHAFELDGVKAFMQDLKPKELDTGLAIAALLIEAPGEQTLEQNKDHFIKRHAVGQLCAGCAAAALFTMQTNAPSGGKGYRTSLRGWGPITTLVLGKKNLWDTCWVNVLAEAQYLGAEADKSEEACRFPWLAPTRTSEAKPPAGITTPIDVHPDQQFWAIPRRIRLIGEDYPQRVRCDMCGELTTQVYRRFITHNYGANYQGFEHPLSPHKIREGIPDCVHPEAGGIGYRHWLGLVVSTADGTRRPARVVERFRSQARDDERVWAFGYDMDKMKARCWYDTQMPLLIAPNDKDQVFKALVEQLIHGAEWVAGILRARIKNALLGKGDTRGNSSFILAHFWSATEGPFYEHTEQLRDCLVTSYGEMPVIERWRTTLRAAALSVFDHYTQAGHFDAVSPRKVATARNDLSKVLGGKKLRSILGLPEFKRKAV